MFENKHNDLAPVGSIYVQASGKPVKQTEYIESSYKSHSIRKDENNKTHAVLKSIWTGIRGGRLG
jgi:hypothetical protein